MSDPKAFLNFYFKMLPKRKYGFSHSILTDGKKAL